mgnify:CR=1 FL=1|jgi:hypothetical protein|uniref:Uncharacterized protein n=1 Tax=viral metagenome TaxID=1070528 RepID=A0A6C0IPP8_9ZZZZ
MNPSLVDYSAKSFILNKLQQCHTTRVNIYSYALNSSILIAFACIVYLTLYYSRKNKLTTAEKKFRMMKEQEFILSKIRFHKELEETKKETTYSNITDLPSIR